MAIVHPIYVGYDDVTGLPVSALTTPIDEDDIALSDVTTNNVTTARHGFTPKAPNDATKFLDGTTAYDTVKDTDLATSDVTTNDVTTSKHGFTPKAPNDATKFLDGTAAYDTVKDSDLSTSDITTNDVTTAKHGFAPKLPNDATKYLDGTGAYTIPPGSSAVSSVFGRTGAVVAATNDYAESQLSFTDITTNDVSTTKHGFAPKAPNDATKYLDGTGAYSVPAGGGGGSPWTTGFSESGSSLANWTTDTGSWSVVSSAFDVDATSTVSRLRITANQGTRMDHFVLSADVKIKSSGITTNSRAGILWQWDGAGAGAPLVELFSSNGTTRQLRGEIDDTSNVVTAFTPSATWAADTFITLMVVVQGGAFSIFLNGVFEVAGAMPNQGGLQTRGGSMYVGLAAKVCKAAFQNIKLSYVARPAGF